MSVEQTKPAGRRRFFPAFLLTILWVAPLIVLMGLGGFVLGRDIFAPHLLTPGQVHGNRPQPVRILSPEEAAAVARDEPSRVWTEGVKESDIPKLDSGDQPRKHKPHHRTTEANPATPSASGDATDAPDATTTTTPTTTNTTPTTDTPPATDSTPSGTADGTKPAPPPAGTDDTVSPD